MATLTPRENTIAELIAFGFSEIEISTKLFIAESTVHTHAKNIRKKIKARSAVDVTRFFILSNLQKFIVAIVFLMLQSYMIISADMYDYRRVKTGKKITKTRRYEIA